jgi:hypothetical protein
MSGEISRYGEHGLSRDARLSRRAIGEFRASGQVRMGQADTEGAVAITKIDVATQATEHAMRQVLRVAVAQQSLEQLAPAASARLNFIAEHSHLLWMTDLLAELRQDLGRL